MKKMGLFLSIIFLNLQVIADESIKTEKSKSDVQQQAQQSLNSCKKLVPVPRIGKGFDSVLCTGFLNSKHNKK